MVPQTAPKPSPFSAPVMPPAVGQSPPATGTSQNQNVTAGTHNSSCLPTISSNLLCHKSSAAAVGFILGSFLFVVLLVASGLAAALVHRRRWHQQEEQLNHGGQSNALVKLEGPYPGVRVVLPGKSGATHLAWPEAADPVASKEYAGRSPDSTLHSTSSYMDLLNTPSGQFRGGAHVAVDISAAAGPSSGGEFQSNSSFAWGIPVVRVGSSTQVLPGRPIEGGGAGGVPRVHRASSAPALLRKGR